MQNKATRCNINADATRRCLEVNSFQQQGQVYAAAESRNDKMQ